MRAPGRDIGTASFPDAPLKIFLHATAEARAHRRHQQMQCVGQPAPLKDVLDDMRRRDERDRGRAQAPSEPRPTPHCRSTKHSSGRLLLSYPVN